jgi:hypothetical protein
MLVNMSANIGLKIPKQLVISMKKAYCPKTISLKFNVWPLSFLAYKSKIRDENYNKYFEALSIARMMNIIVASYTPLTSSPLFILFQAIL